MSFLSSFWARTQRFLLYHNTFYRNKYYIGILIVLNTDQSIFTLQKKNDKELLIPYTTLKGVYPKEIWIGNSHDKKKKCIYNYNDPSISDPEWEIKDLIKVLQKKID